MPANESSSRSIDITVYGATSFVAKHVLQYLLKTTQKENKTLRLTLAGRNLKKLEALQASLEKDKDHGDQPKIHMDTFVADGSDLTALSSMALRTQVVLNCAGPYALCSSGVVQACAKEGTDYVDITGEISWVAAMRQQFGSLAQASGARIVSLCGYDSIPTDMIVFAGVQALRERVGHDVEIDDVEVWYQMYAIPNGGTIQTAMELPIDLAKDFFWTPSGENQTRQLRPIPFFLGDPLLLTHPTQVRHNPDYDAMRFRLAKGEWYNQLLSIHSNFALGVSMPMPLSPVNLKVAHASAVALNYGPNVSIRERYVPLGFYWTRIVGLLSFFPLLFVQCIMLWGLALAKIPFLGKAVIGWLAPSGSGLPDALCGLGNNSLYATVTAKKKDQEGKVDRAYVSWTLQGDAGNWVTAQCVSEAALSLLWSRDLLPPKSDDGFGTPAQVLGPALWHRLQHAQIRPTQQHLLVRTGVPQRETKLHYYPETS